MKLYLSLVKALIAGVEPSNQEKKYNKIFYGVMSFIAVFCIMLPMAFFVGVIIYYAASALIPYGTSENALELFLHLISAFSFIFGLNVIFSVFYFSGDIESLLPLPLKPYQIIGSKFTAALISESVMEFIVILAAMIGYLAAMGLPFYSWITAFLTMLIMPVIPLIYCAILGMVIMYFTRFIRNKDRVNQMTGILTFILIAGIVFLISKTGFNSDQLITAISTKDNPVLNIMNVIFPQVPLAVGAMSGNILLSFFLYLLINIIAVMIFMFAAQFLYFPGVIGMNSAAPAKSGQKSSDIISKMKQHSIFLTYLKKEFRILFRTPAYFMNCVLINLIWPIFIYLLSVMQGQTNFMDEFIYNIQSGNEETVLLFLLGVSAVSVLVTAMNCIASSALTREGKHFAFIKYIPVPYMTQLNIKAFISIIISGGGMLVYVTAACIWLNMGVKFILFCCLVSLLSVSFASYFGIFMDSVNPKLIWDDELNALRGNYNVFFNMAVAIVLEAVICLAAYLAFKYTNIGALMIIMILFTILMILNVVSYLLCQYQATKNIDQLAV